LENVWKVEAGSEIAYFDSEEEALAHALEYLDSGYEISVWCDNEMKYCRYKDMGHYLVKPGVVPLKLYKMYRERAGEGATLQDFKASLEFQEEILREREIGAWLRGKLLTKE